MRVGQPINGFCQGMLGRDSFGDRRVEALGHDWVVLRDNYGIAEFFHGVPEELERAASE